MPGALLECFFPNDSSKTFASLKRYRGALDTADAQSSKPESLAGLDAAKLITESDFVEPEGDVEQDSALLGKGQNVALWRTDQSAFSRSKNRDLGSLSILTSYETVVTK